MKKLRLLSFNIHGGRSLDGVRDIRRVHLLLDRLDIDIAVIQEMETRRSKKSAPEDLMLLAGPTRPHHLIGASLKEDNGWFGNALISRYPITHSLVHNLETGPDLEPRNAVDARIETPMGSIRVIGTHLSLSYRERRSEAGNLLRLMRAVEESEPNPLFLLGDINEWQWRSKLIDFLDKEMRPLPCRATFPSYFPVFRLDRAWYEAPEAYHVTAHRLYEKKTRLLSDHLPIMVEVTLP